MRAGFPVDPAQWIALGLAIAVAVRGGLLVRPARNPARFVALCAVAAAALSAVYVFIYLRGGPRIIDATSYFLEARAMARGHLAWPIEAPETSVLGRFLVRSEGPDGARAAVIFPPGYPALLALGFLVGAPLAVGPLLAAAIAWVTYDLASLVARDLRGPATHDDANLSIPQIALVFSVICAALRYHTADTMSHGLAALCTSLALVLTLRARDADAASLPRRAIALAAGAGLAAGWLFATRPASALALAPILALAARDPTAPLSSRAILRLAPAFAVATIPGVALFLAHQRAATGAWGVSSQGLYYALADGPSGCFRYGFGAGIGCVAEHGDFVRAHLQHGYGAIAAAGTTLRRLHMHLVDPANLEPLALLVPAGAILAWRSRRVRLLALLVVAQIAAYAPFYFDGNYPGGGARFFADVLPVEHVLAAIAVARIAALRPSPERWAAAPIALALLGFALRAGFDHAQLRDRDGGRPMFDPAVIARAGVTAGLVFVDTDHGFDLGFDLGARASTGVVVARLHGDAIDRLVWESHGRPPAFFYRFEGGASPDAITPLPLGSLTTIEAESLWPPVLQRGGHAARVHAGGTCASGGRMLSLQPDARGRPATIALEIPAIWAAGHAIRPRVVIANGARGALELLVDGASAARWPLDSKGSTGLSCVDLQPAAVPIHARRVTLALTRDPETEASSQSSADEPPAGIAALDSVRLE